MLLNINVYLSCIILLISIFNETLGRNYTKRNNILMLVVDDLRDILQIRRAHACLYTPNIDALAGKSFIFKNAFAQQALCAPSRNSFLTGRRPDTLHLYDFYNYWRTGSNNYTTIPQYFKENGYKTYSFGKVFHPGISSNYTDDFPYSWSELPYHPSTEIYKDAKVCKDEETLKMADNLICPVILKFQPEQILPDIQITNAAISKLLDHKKNHVTEPYFMAVGFHKPHVPLKFPKQYLDHYPLENISLPDQSWKPPSMPNVAWNPWTDVRARDDMKLLNISFPFGRIPDDWAVRIIQSYYAAVSYVDDMIGKIIQHVDTNNTVILLTSDHGWSLGEHGEWAKYSNFDVALKVPLVIYTPDLELHSRKRFHVNEVVELVDMFPTLVDLSNVNGYIPICENVNEITCAEGQSLVALMKKSHKKWRKSAFSQYPRPGNFPSNHPNSDKPRLDQIKIMGYTIRTKRFRYTEWVHFDNVLCLPNWDLVYGVELYDHLIDEGENLNLADRKEMEFTIRRLKKKLHLGWRGDLEN